MLSEAKHLIFGLLQEVYCWQLTDREKLITNSPSDFQKPKSALASSAAANTSSSGFSSQAVSPISV